MSRDGVTAAPRQTEDSGQRSVAALIGFGVAAVLVFAVLVSLGAWQVKRLAWKEALIARVDARVHAVPMPPPGPIDWPTVNAQDDAYRHVVISGTFDTTRDVEVQAVTALGAGYWIVTPLTTATGDVVLINRGFVPADHRDAATRRSGDRVGQTTVTGLLRVTEPMGAFLRSNDPAGDRWYSRDVAAIAAARGLTHVAPYFIDADAAPDAGDAPVGGLTVIEFPNNHLVYALTWFGMAALLAGATAWVGRDEWRRRTMRRPAMAAASR